MLQGERAKWFPDCERKIIVIEYLKHCKEYRKVMIASVSLTLALNKGTGGLA